MNQQGDTNNEWLQSAFTCGICTNVVHEPVQMTCSGEHIFCFDCIFKYYQARSVDEINCPNCRRGNGSVVVVSKLGTLLQRYLTLNPLPVEEEDVSDDGEVVRRIGFADYKRLLPLLIRRFPKKSSTAEGSCVILNDQFALFARNYQTLCDITNDIPPPSTGRVWVDEYGDRLTRRWHASPSDNDLSIHLPEPLDTLPTVFRQPPVVPNLRQTLRDPPVRQNGQRLFPNITIPTPYDPTTTSPFLTSVRYPWMYQNDSPPRHMPQNVSTPDTSNEAARSGLIDTAERFIQIARMFHANESDVQMD